jgi:hypothetical protein
MQPPEVERESLSDEDFRAALRGLIARSGRSMRGMSLAMGRDPGYVAALLDPSRPSRARPTPDDLVALSDATAIPLVELLEALWAIPVGRLAAELERLDPGAAGAWLPAGLTADQRRTVAEYARFVASRDPLRPRPSESRGG